MKPAAAEARKAQALEALAKAQVEMNQKLDLILTYLETNSKPAADAPEKPQVTPVEPEAQTAEERAEAITEPVPTVKPAGRRNR